MNFRTLVTPVIVAVAVSMLAFAAFVLVAAHVRDAESIANEEKVIRQNISAAASALMAIAEDNAWWDDSVDHIILNEDRDWMTRTLGESVEAMQSIQGVLVLTPEGRIIYEKLEGSLPSAHVLAQNGFGLIARSLEAPVDNRPVSTSGLVLIDGQLIVFGASMIVPAGSVPLIRPIPEGRQPVIFFFSHLTGEKLLQAGLDNAIENLHFHQPGATNKAMSPVLDASGRDIGSLSWDPATPGSRMARDMLLPFAALLLIVALALSRFIKRASQMVEELAQANRAKSAFLASMSHEIRTPLNSILGFTELLSLELYGKVEGEKNKEYLRLVKKSGNHLLAVINDILDISKLEAGRFDIFAEKVQINRLADACRAIIEPTATEKHISIETGCQPAELLSDERIIRQIILNILSNSVKFTDPGGSVKMTGEQNGDFYFLRIADTGIGMKKHEIALALSLFGQVQNEYVRSNIGTGLGLPLVNRFMTLLDGAMEIQSMPGIGTTVTLRFPLVTKAKNLPSSLV